MDIVVNDLRGERWMVDNGYFEEIVVVAAFSHRDDMSNEKYKSVVEEELDVGGVWNEEAISQIGNTIKHRIAFIKNQFLHKIMII